MIRAEVVYLDGCFHSLNVNGHGGEEKGTDIYCAGVSTCLIGALNALEHGEDYSIELSSGRSEVIAVRKPSLHDEIVMETLICQLETIAKSYPTRVQIKIS